VNPLGLILFALIAFGGWVWLQRQPAQRRTRAALKLTLLLILLGMLFLAITGRLHWLGALVALLLPLAQRLLPLLTRLLPLLAGRHRSSRRQPSGNNRSQVRSRMIEMSLDHDSGIIQGRVLAGDLQGRELGSLSKTEFLQLLQECRASDADSTRLLENYLDKRFGQEWRADDPGQERRERQPQTSGAAMTRDEAYAILGLEPGASRQAIIEAHRKLMQRNHPDRGGSAWLAARINDARALLLEE